MPAAGGDASVEVVDSLEGFDRLEAAWTDLLAASDSNSVFLTWDWLHAWWRQFRAGRHLWLLAVRSGGRLAGLAPLSIGASRSLVPGLSVAEFLGTGAVGSDYLDVITRRGFESSVSEALAHWLARTNGVVLRLHGVARQGSQAERLARRLVARGWTMEAAPAGACPYLPIAGQSWEDVLAGFGPRHRKNVRRGIRNLARTFDVSFDEAVSEPERRDALDALVRLHGARWRPRGGSTALHTPDLVAFHREVTRRLQARGWLRLFVLRLNGAAAACLYGIHYGRTFSFYQCGFDERFARYSPGLVTLAASLRRAVEEGAEEFDLLHGEEAYKAHWASEARELMRLEIYPPGVRAYLHRMATAARLTASRWGRPWLRPMRQTATRWRRRLQWNDTEWGT